MPNSFRGTRLPTFPAKWYHPIYGAREIKTFDEYLKLDQDWRETPGVADMDRTQTEAEVVMNHNQQVKREMAMEAYRERQGSQDQGERPEGATVAEGRGPGEGEGAQRPAGTGPFLGHSEFAFSRKSKHPENDAIVRNSVQAQESLNKGNSEPL